METGSWGVAVVADDHELFRVALAEMLVREGLFRVVLEASTYQGAIDHLEANPNVVFAGLDLQMPGMNVEKSFQRIRTAYPAVRVAAITASESREGILRSLRAGVHGYIPKSLRIREVVDAIRMVLEGKVFVPATLADSDELEVVVGPETEAVQLPQRPQPRPIPIAALSARQSEVLGLIALGNSNKEIARHLRLAEGTVKVHVNALYRVLGVRNRVGAVSAMATLPLVSG